ncbi:MAG: hypothetical protein ACLQPH_08435, partial [Acidimicrobiales bacterium]
MHFSTGISAILMHRPKWRALIQQCPLQLVVLEGDKRMADNDMERHWSAVGEKVRDRRDDNLLA